MSMMKELLAARDFIRKQTTVIPTVGIVLGSGLGDFAQKIQVSSTISYADIPHFKCPKVKGHGGELILGQIGTTTVAILSGRIHLYEGHSPQEAVRMVRVLRLVGIKQLVLTNAAGGIDPSYVPGDLALITDHINYMGVNPLIGENLPDLGERFPDMSYAYSERLNGIFRQASKEIGFALREGVYGAMLGPSYETPAEIRKLQKDGVSLVGMSTVPEVIAANHMGLEVCGISCVTNMAAGLSKNKLDHKEVTREGENVKERFAQLLIAGISQFI